MKEDNKSHEEKNFISDHRCIAVMCALGIVAIAVAVTIIFMFWDTNRVASDNLMKNITASEVGTVTLEDEFVTSTADFSMNLFNNTTVKEKNSLISPVSALSALAMTANGADNKTLEQMSRVLGNGMSLEHLNLYLYSFAKSLPSIDKSKLSIANSIWFRDDENRLEVKKDFLQKNADFFDAEAYKSAFDSKTLKDINNWVYRNTDGMIEKILDKINPDTIMYLINSITFDAEWKDKYTSSDVHNGKFTDYKGDKDNVSFMNSVESLYISANNATGFIKPYYGDKYSFVAILPSEGVSLSDYTKRLSGQKFVEMIKNAQKKSVETSLPKFSAEYSVQMADALVALGMPDAFSPDDADFSKMAVSARGNIYIGEVLHKTYIEVNENGTRAAAVTKVEMRETSMPFFENKVILDRPFLYAIIDNKTCLPIFMGTVVDIQ